MRLFLLILIFTGSLNAYAQYSGSVIVGGDLDKFYPVTWTDGGWHVNSASEITIARSSSHTDGGFRGSIIAAFKYHTTMWGHLSNFIDAEIYQDLDPSKQFIGGWRDATTNNVSNVIIIWLRGENTTYYYHSTHPVSVATYDGVANNLPYQEGNGPAHSYKMAIDAYVNRLGTTQTGTAYFLGSGTSLFNGSVAIGTTDAKGYKLAVAGDMIAESVKVKQQGAWPDFVFAKDYKLPSLAEVEKHITARSHLPNIPSAEEVKANGIDLGEMNAKLLQKIEELTLHLIEMKKENDLQRKDI